MLRELSRMFYAGGRRSRDLAAIEASIATGSPVPILKRMANRWIGRNIVSRLWIR